MTNARSKTAASLALALLLALAGAPPALARDESGSGSGGSGSGGGGNGGGDSLALRVNDATGVPGGLVAVVVRTYASRAIRRGQVCLRATASGASAAPSPLSGLEGALVFSPRGDVTARNSFSNQRATVSFSSPSGTINSADGPMAVLYFRLGTDLQPGQRYDLVLDPAETSLVDGEGRPLAVDPRPGRLEIKGRAAPFQLAAVGARVRPGRVVGLGLETSEPAAVRRGRIDLRWDARAAAGLPQVRMDPRYGNAVFEVTRLGPGRAVVRFVSPDATLNRVPGRLLEVLLPTSPAAQPGTRTPVTLDPGLTFLEGPDGERLPLELENGVLAFR